MGIKFVPYQEINKLKWDVCIRNSFNGLIYGYSWFLDIVCENWDALIEGDYERVMPMPYKTEWSINKIYQPHFAYQLGIFSTSKLTPRVGKDFIEAIPKQFKVIHLYLNRFNKIGNAQTEYNTGTDYQIDLIQEYPQLGRRFTDQTKSNIETAKHNGLKLKQALTPEEFIKFYMRHAHDLDQLTALRFRSLLKTLSQLEVGKIVGVYDKKDSLVAVGFFVSYLNSSSLLAQASSGTGNKKHALTWLINDFILTNSRKNVTLTFPDVRDHRFQKTLQGFGCYKGHYVHVHKNKLPFPIRYIIN